MTMFALTPGSRVVVQLCCIAAHTHVLAACSAVQLAGCIPKCSEPREPLQVSGLKSSTSGSLAAFDRMEQKVVAMEAEADAVGQGCSAHSAPSYLLCLLGYTCLPTTCYAPAICCTC